MKETNMTRKINRPGQRLPEGPPPHEPPHEQAALAAFTRLPPVEQAAWERRARKIYGPAVPRPVLLRAAARLWNEWGRHSSSAPPAPPVP